MITYEVRVYEDGSKEWLLNGELHREDGPAIESKGFCNGWFLNGKLHRTDGPALEYADGSKSWGLEGIFLTEQEFNERMNPTKEMTVAEISEALGFNVKVVR